MSQRRKRSNAGRKRKPNKQRRKTTPQTDSKVPRAVVAPRDADEERARRYRVADIPKRTLLTRERYTPDSSYGSVPAQRDLDELFRTGILVIDKPKGPNSHQVSAWVRDIFEAERAGHGGTLDPKVTGVLTVALDDATKAIGFQHVGGKSYVGVMRFHRDIEGDRVRAMFEEFVGEIYQLPPVRSAVKRQLRIREIYALDLIEHDGRDVLFKVVCEAGTYIRVLARDVGDALGLGAHLQQLRRTRASVFSERDLVTLHDAKDAFVIWREDGDETELRKVLRPFEDILTILPQVVIKDTAVNAIAYGADLAVVGVVQCDSGLVPGDLVRIQTARGESVAVGEAQMRAQTMVDAKSGICVRTTRVFYPRDVYPKVWGEREDAT